LTLDVAPQVEAVTVRVPESVALVGVPQASRVQVLTQRTVSQLRPETVTGPGESAAFRDRENGKHASTPAETCSVALRASNQTDGAPPAQ
jgi:hypothetical protein